MNTDAKTTQRYLAALVSCLVLTGLSIAFIDRPAASWAHTLLRGNPIFVWHTHIVDPLEPAAVVGLAIAGLAAALGWRPGEWGKTIIAACLAVAISVVIKDQLKFVFGRTWPETWTNHNPSWVGNGVYGFSPFHGGDGWGSFPSGHMTRISAFAAVMWQRVPRLRWLAATLVALVAIGLFGANFHFVGDIVAGTYLGIACGIGVLALL